MGTVGTFLSLVSARGSQTLPLSGIPWGGGLLKHDGIFNHVLHSAGALGTTGLSECL